MGLDRTFRKVGVNTFAFWAFCSVSLFLFCCWFFQLTYNPDQFRAFFLSCDDLFADFTNVMVYSRKLDPYGLSTIGERCEHAYLPLSYLITFVFSAPLPVELFSEKTVWQDPQLLIVITLFFTIVTSVFAIQLFSSIDGKSIRKFIGTLTVLLSHLFIAAFERGNLIILTSIFIMFFLLFYDSSNKVIKELSFISLALAASLKMTPAIFGFLLIIKGRYKEALRLVIYGVIAALLPFVFIVNGFSNIPVLIENIGLNIEEYRSVIGCGMSSLGLLFFPGKITIECVFFVIMIILSGIILVSSFFLKKKWHIVMAISLLSIMLPSHSETYNALFLIPALVLMFNDKELKKIELLYFIPFISIFCSICFFKDVSPNEYVCVATTALMVIMVFVTSLPTIINAIKNGEFKIESKQ